MKILFITSLYHPNEPGGAEILTRRLAEYLVKKGVSVTILSFDAEKSSTHKKENGLEVFKLYIEKVSEILNETSAKRFPVGRIRLFRLLINPFIWKKIKSEVNKFLSKESEFDIIHFANSMNLIPSGKLIKFFRQKLPGVKRVLTFHDFFFLGRRSVYPNNKIPIVSSAKNKIVKEYIDYFITPSDFVKNVVLNDLGIKEERVQRIYNYIQKEDHFVKNSYSYPIKIIYAGALEIEKGMDILIKSFTQLYRIHNNKIKLILIGNGGYLSEAKRLLEEIPPGVYSILPWMPHKEVIKYLSESDIFVLPSRYNETFGMGLIEAFIYGCLPIGSGRGAIPEVLNYDKELIFNTIEELNQILNSFIKDPQLISRKYDSIREHMKTFITNETYKEYYNFYNSLK